MKISLKNTKLVFQKAKSIVTPSSTTDGYFMISTSSTTYPNKAFYKDLSSSTDANKLYNTKFYILSSTGINVGDTIHVKSTHLGTQPILVFLSSDELTSSSSADSWLAADIEHYLGENAVSSSTLFKSADNDYVVPEGTKCIAICWRNTVASYEAVLSV